MEIIRRLRASVALVLMQLELHGRLACVEWQQEKNRLQQLLVFGTLGLIFLFCFILSIGLLAIALAWTTEYRWFAIVGVVVFYALGIVFCYFRCKRYAALGEESFKATRAEIAADIALIRSQL